MCFAIGGRYDRRTRKKYVRGPVQQFYHSGAKPSGTPRQNMEALFFDWCKEARQTRKVIPTVYNTGRIEGGGGIDLGPASSTEWFDTSLAANTYDQTVDTFLISNTDGKTVDALLKLKTPRTRWLK